ncbi:MAG TPA: hypothetical protein VMV07_24575 [Streptosporangiaceae bacterium]|nr:hypothetical protein [Streptosporangiaceae bacterium]
MHAVVQSAQKITMRYHPPAFLIPAAILALALAAASCGTSTPAGSQRPTSTASPAKSAGVTSSPAISSPALSSSNPPATGPAAGCDTGPWQTAPVSVTRHVAVPPVPVISRARTAAHPECGYDRLALDVSGPVPQYTIRYVTHVTGDPSGKPMTVPGQRYLLITLHPAQAHTDSGAATIPRQAQALGYPMLKGYALAGDFEGIVSLALGLRAATSIRVYQSPGRLYIDLRT